MKVIEKNRLIDVVFDEKWIDFFYLNLEPEDLLDKFSKIKLKKTDNLSKVPFTAQLKNYSAAIDRSRISG